MDMKKEEKEVGSLLKYPGHFLREEEKLERIRQIAYYFFEQEGSRPGTEFESWLEAAQIVKSMG